MHLLYASYNNYLFIMSQTYTKIIKPCKHINIILMLLYHTKIKYKKKTSNLPKNPYTFFLSLSSNPHQIFPNNLHSPKNLTYFFTLASFQIKKIFSPKNLHHFANTKAILISSTNNILEISGKNHFYL